MQNAKQLEQNAILLLPSISGYFHVDKYLMIFKMRHVSCYCPLYRAIFTLFFSRIINAFICYCPLYRAIFTNFYMNYFHIRKQLLPSISGYFHDSGKLRLVYGLICYCPLYRAIFTIINIMIL